VEAPRPTQTSTARGGEGPMRAVMKGSVREEK